MNMSDAVSSEDDDGDDNIDNKSMVNLLTIGMSKLTMINLLCKKEDFDFDIDVDHHTTILRQNPGHKAHTSPWTGFKIVGNNLDKNIRPSFQQIDHQTKPLHICNL